jgi:outer membrane protein
MKKIIALILALGFFGGVAFAADYTNIGFIDVQKVFTEYKETKKAQEELKKEEADFKKEFEASQKTLKDAQTAGKTKEEIDKLQKDLEAKLEPKRKKLLSLNDKLTTQLQSKILDGVKKVAKKLGVDLVLDKQVVITGGMDLTQMVTTELNK